MRKAGRAGQMFLPPPGVILGATGVYKCDKGLFARGLCILKCVHRCVQKCVQCVQSVSALGARRKGERAADYGTTGLRTTGPRTRCARVCKVFGWARKILKFDYA